jgi:hypothetical protein
MSTEENKATAFEFDCFPARVGTVEIREDNETSRIVLCLDGHEEDLIKARRDQWGVFHFTSSSCVAQEDQTRSFLHALASAVNQLREMMEFETTESTPVQTPKSPDP